MNPGIPTTTTEARARIGMIQYYRDMWHGRSCILDSLTEAAINPKGRKMLWNHALYFFGELKHMVSSETLLSYLYWNVQFTVHTDSPEKQLGNVISQNNKTIAFLSRRLNNTQCNYTTTKT